MIADIHCCDKAKNLECLETCRKILDTASSEKEILDLLEVKCSPVKPQLPIWSCLLEHIPSKLNRLPLDASKLLCCAKAATSNCENLCRNAYFTDWKLSWTLLETDCLSSNRENELKLCLEDANGLCKFGCSGLSFCSTFNDRFSTSFR